MLRRLVWIWQKTFSWPPWRIVELREFNPAGFLTWLGTLSAGSVIGLEDCGRAYHCGFTAQRLGGPPG